MAVPTGKALPIFDAHFHIIDTRFPLVPNQGYLPQPFTVKDYQARADELGVTGGAIVSGSFQAFDQTYLTDALATFGPSYVGVTQLRASVKDEEILRLDAAGIRGVRFNVVRGGSEKITELASFARRIHDLAKWHIELYIESRALGEVMSTLQGLPAFSIDHLGLTRDGYHDLLRLVEQGAYVKASGFGRVDLDIRAVVRDICAMNPVALMFGTDLPSTRARRPFREDDIALLRECLDDQQVRRVLHDNAVAFYRVAA